MNSFATVLEASAGALLAGFVLTIAVSASAIVVGVVLGLFVGILLTYGGKVIGLTFRAFVDIVRGTPVLVLILATYYMPAGFGISPGPVQAGIAALSIFCAAHIAETLRGAFNAIPAGQIDAARAIGLTFWQMLGYVLVPQALRQIAPNLVNTAVEIVKASSLLSAIGVGELLLTTQEIIGRSFMTMEFYALTGGLYLILNLAIAFGGSWLERTYRAR